MALLDALLGKPAETRPSTLFQPQAQFLESQFFPQLSSLFQGFDPSQLTPGFNPLQQQGQQAALQAAGQFGQSFLDPAQQALSTLFGSADPNNPLTQGAISAATSPIFENFQNVIAPSIRRASIGNQPGGGSRGASQIAQAGGQALRTAGDIGAGIAERSRLSGLNAIQGGLGMIPSIANLSFLPSEVQRQIGGEQRQLGIEQAAAPLSLMQLFQGLAGPPTVLGGGGTGPGRGIADLFSFNIGLGNSPSGIGIG